MRSQLVDASSTVVIRRQQHARISAFGSEASSSSSSASSTPAPAEQAQAPAAPPASTKQAPAKAPSKPATDHLPPFKVLLHNDDENDQLYVVRALVDVAHVPIHQAFELMMEAHNKGLSLVKVTHREHAELLMEQLRSKGLIATIEQN